MMKTGRGMGMVRKNRFRNDRKREKEGNRGSGEEKVLPRNHAPRSPTDLHADDEKGREGKGSVEATHGTLESGHPLQLGTPLSLSPPLSLFPVSLALSL